MNTLGPISGKDAEIEMLRKEVERSRVQYLYSVHMLEDAKKDNKAMEFLLKQIFAGVKEGFQRQKHVKELYAAAKR